MAHAGCVRVFGALALAAATLTPSAAYYHYTHYLNRTSPYQPILEKFDLSALPNKTVTFYVSDNGPTSFSGNDSFASVLNQIRQAAQVWNSVETSDLRVAFGGLDTSGTPQSTPGSEIVFEDIPPGLLAFAAPTVRADATTGPNGAFVPILRSVVHLNNDLTKRPGPSYLEAFFGTIVHEMGHALGLQHTFTSATMSTAPTRATNRAKPIDDDDIAAISLLYPSRAFAGSFGSVSGRVTSSGQGVHLASVVAIRVNGSAVSSLTNPDGTYRIDGIPPGTYYVYVHPLPPSADIQLPVDPSGQAVQPRNPTETLFYGFPATRDPQRAFAVSVTRGNTASGIDFNVQPRAAVSVYDVSTYSFFGQNPVGPAVANAGAATAVLTARGSGITVGAGLAPGLGVQVLGTVPVYVPAGNLRAYGAPTTTLAFDLQLNPFVGTGSRHLVFTLPNDIYVLPNAFTFVSEAPPSITNVTSGGDGGVTITGSSLEADSRIFFDGVPAMVRTPFSGTDSAGSIQVTPPSGFSGQIATVTVYNPDGQNSTYVQPNPPTYSYAPQEPPAVFVNPQSLPAGANAMVEVVGANTRFVDGQVSLGFGSNDVFVRRTWVTGANRLIANVQVAPGAPQVNTQTSVISGFQVIAQPSGFRIDGPNPRLPAINLPVTGANQAQISPGSVATVTGTNLVAQGSATLTLNEQPVQVLSASATQINFLVPSGTPVGPAVLKLNNGADNAFPVLVQIDAPPPAITGVLNLSNAPLDSLHPAQAGGLAMLLATNLDAGVTFSSGRLRVSVSGSEAQILAINPMAGLPGVVQVVFVLPQGIIGPQIPLAIAVDGNSSSAVAIPVIG